MDEDKIVSHKLHVKNSEDKRGYIPPSFVQRHGIVDSLPKPYIIYELNMDNL